MGRRKYSVLERNFVQERANGCCEYCKFPYKFSHAAFHIEHIIPLQKKGSDELENLAFACDGCNSLKWTYTEWIDPDTKTVVPLFNPRSQKWEEHFVWDHDFITILGLSSVGRVTVNLLQLNRVGLLNIRKALLAIGAHPFTAD